MWMHALRRIKYAMRGPSGVLGGAPDKSVDIVYFDPMFRSRFMNRRSIAAAAGACAIGAPRMSDSMRQAVRVARKSVVMKEHSDSGEFERLGFERQSMRNKIAYGVITSIMSVQNQHNAREKAEAARAGWADRGRQDAISLEIAKAWNAEIISGDSMQVYRGMDIGTAKIKPEEREGIPHHLIDICDPDAAVLRRRISRALRSDCIQEIAARGKLPFIVGGTGLYVESRRVRLSISPKSAPTKRSARSRSSIALETWRGGAA